MWVSKASKFVTFSMQSLLFAEWKTVIYRYISHSNKALLCEDYSCIYDTDLVFEISAFCK